MEKTYFSFYNPYRQKVASIEKKNQDFSSFLKGVERRRQETSQNRRMEKKLKESCLDFYVKRKKILPGSLAPVEHHSNRLSIVRFQSGKNLLTSKKYQDEPDYTIESSDKRKSSTLYNERKCSRIQTKSSSSKINFRSEKWRLHLTEEEKNSLCFGKELRMGKQLRIKYTKQDQFSIRKVLRKSKNEVFEEIRKKKFPLYGSKYMKRSQHKLDKQNKKKFIDLSNQESILP